MLEINLILIDKNVHILYLLTLNIIIKEITQLFIH
jgi:hypothetical protein